MRRLRRSAVVAVAVAGLALIGSAVQGLAAVDGRLAAATKQQRQERMLQIKQQRPQLLVPHNCPNVRARAVQTRAL
jgi:hypothetical protein